MKFVEGEIVVIGFVTNTGVRDIEGIVTGIHKHLMGDKLEVTFGKEKLYFFPDGSFFKFLGPMLRRITK